MLCDKKYGPFISNAIRTEATALLYLSIFVSGETSEKRAKKENVGLKWIKVDKL